MDFKKFALILAAAMLLCMVLCACGDTGTEETNGTEGSTAGTTGTQPDPIQSTASPTEDDGKVTYTVLVVDQNNNPVPGVKLQFCDEESCRLPVTTGEDGTVTASYTASEYHITLTYIPEGFESEETAFYFGDQTQLTVVLTAISQ